MISLTLTEWEVFDLGGLDTFLEIVEYTIYAYLHKIVVTTRKMLGITRNHT